MRSRSRVRERRRKRPRRPSDEAPRFHEKRRERRLASSSSAVRPPAQTPGAVPYFGSASTALSRCPRDWRLRPEAKLSRPNLGIPQQGAQRSRQGRRRPHGHRHWVQRLGSYSSQGRPGRVSGRHHRPASVLRLDHRGHRVGWRDWGMTVACAGHRREPAPIMVAKGEAGLPSGATIPRDGFRHLRTPGADERKRNARHEHRSRHGLHRARDRSVRWTVAGPNGCLPHVRSRARRDHRQRWAPCGIFVTYAAGFRPSRAEHSGTLQRLRHGVAPAGFRSVSLC